MPRVSEEHLEGRRRQILDAATRCFAENGFHATSMQDVFAASQLSPGAVYRYFRGKHELIEAIAKEGVGHLLTVVEEAMRTDPPPAIEDVLGGMLRAVGTVAERDLRARISVQIWAEAMRDPSLATLLRDLLIGRLLPVFAELLAGAQARGEVDRRLDPLYAARALLSLVPGFILQRSLDSDVRTSTYEHAARALIAGRFHLTPAETRSTRDESRAETRSLPKSD